MASLAANVAVAQPTATGRVIAAWLSFALIVAYELLMRQVRHTADTGQSPRRPARVRRRAVTGVQASDAELPAERAGAGGGQARDGGAGLDLRLRAWQWPQTNRSGDGSLPTGKEIGSKYGCHERWGRLVKRSGLEGELNTQS